MNPHHFSFIMWGIYYEEVIFNLYPISFGANI